MDLAKLTVTDEKLNELYLYMTLRTDFYHQYIVGFASGTTVLHLNTNGIAWYKVLIPPIRRSYEKYLPADLQKHLRESTTRRATRLATAHADERASNLQERKKLNA